MTINKISTFAAGLYLLTTFAQAGAADPASADKTTEHADHPHEHAEHNHAEHREHAESKPANRVMDNNDTYSSVELAPLPSQFSADKSNKFNEQKWRQMTDQGLAALNGKSFKSAETFFQAALREATKAPSMSTFMVDSLVHTAEVYRQTNRKAEAKDYFDQALDMAKMLVPEKCPYCKSEKESIPVIYGPHSDELEAWVTAKAAKLGDFKAVTAAKRKQRPAWYCKMCEVSY